MQFRSLRESQRGDTFLLAFQADLPNRSVNLLVAGTIEQSQGSQRVPGARYLFDDLQLLCLQPYGENRSELTLQVPGHAPRIIKADKFAAFSAMDAGRAWRQFTEGISFADQVSMAFPGDDPLGVIGKRLAFTPTESQVEVPFVVAGLAVNVREMRLLAHPQAKLDQDYLAGVVVTDPHHFQGTLQMRDLPNPWHGRTGRYSFL